jgi:hypothetical protein
MTNLTRNQYEMLAEFARNNLHPDQIFKLSGWLAVYNSNYNSTRFLLACGIPENKIIEYFRESITA